MEYLKEVLKPANLPNWFSLVAVIAVLYTLNTELSRSEVEKQKLAFVESFMLQNTPIPFVEVTADETKLRAMSELVADGLALQTARGYEATRFDSRLKDDTMIAMHLALAKHQPEVANVAKESQTLPVFYFPKNCADINAVIEDTQAMIIKFEQLRGRSPNLKFSQHVASHQDNLLKQLYFNTGRSAGDYALAQSCF